MKNSAEDSAISNLEADAWNGTQHGMEGPGGQWDECSHRGSGVPLWGWASRVKHPGRCAGTCY